MLNLDQFCAKWAGVRCNFDANRLYNGQCTQIVKMWALKNGWSVPNGGGQDAYGYRNFRSGYIWCKNTLTAVPMPGDIVVFKQNVNHVAIARPSNVINLFTFDQNWPKGAKCNYVTHRFYSGVLGWLHWLG
jgi:hypothetical protein